MKLCTNQCSNLRPEIPEQMKRGHYQNTTRIPPNAAVVHAAEVSDDPYEQTFPDYETDFRYFSRLYPRMLRPHVPTVQKLCDQLEYKGSLLFDRYPDHESIQKLAGQLAEETGLDADCIMMMLLHELLLRRERYRKTVPHKRPSAEYLPEKMSPAAELNW